MHVDRDGRSWRLGGDADVAWLGGRPHGCSIATALPLVFDAYATVAPPGGVDVVGHERALVAHLAEHSGEQAWWLGFLDTGAHDVVFPDAPRVRLYWDWPYVLVLAGPAQALGWRTGHMRDDRGALPDLLLPEDRSWLVSALWDDTWACVGGPLPLVEALQRDPLVAARRVQPHDEDVLPPGHSRE